MNKRVKRIVNELKSKGIKVMVPNFFTAIRMIGAFKIPSQMKNGQTKEAAMLAAICGLSDAVDGKVARALDAETEFGAKFDQIVDKGFAVSLMIPLIEKDPKWATIILGELAIALTNLEKEAKGKKVDSSIEGKIKTVVLFSAIALTYLSDALNLKDPVIKKSLDLLFGASVAMEIITLFGYLNYHEPLVEPRPVVLTKTAD